MSSTQLVVELQAGGDQVVDFFTTLDPVVVVTPISASEHPGGRPWSPRDHLAHLVRREADFLPIARRVIAQEPNPVRLENRGSTEQESSAFLNRENQEMIEAREHETVGVLLEEFAVLRSTLVSLVERLSSNDLARSVEIAPGRVVAVGVLLSSSDRHARSHLQTLSAKLTHRSAASRLE